MSKNTAQILDFNSYRQKSVKLESPAPQENMVPVMMWMPVWVMVPNHTNQN